MIVDLPIEIKLSYHLEYAKGAENAEGEKFDLHLEDIRSHTLRH